MSTISTATNSLWPAEIKPGIQSPWALLNAQKEALAKQTDGILVGFLGREELPGKRVRLWLDIVAPDLNDYHHRILDAEYSDIQPEKLYPVKVDGAALRQKQQNRQRFANSEAELNEIIAEVLKSEMVIAAAQSLIAKATDVRKKKEHAARSAGDSSSTSNGSETEAI